MPTLVTPFIIATYLAMLYIAAMIGPYTVYLACYVGFGALFLIGTIKEKKELWPFNSNPNANWLAGIVGFFTVSAGASSWKVLVDTNLNWTYVFLITILIMYGVVGAKRNWF